MSPLGTGPKYNNHPLLRRWLWTKPSWWSISHSLIYSCVSAKQPSYKQKHQQELLKYPGTLESRFGRRIKHKEIPFVLLSFELFDENWGLQGNFKPCNTHMNSYWYCRQLKLNKLTNIRNKGIHGCISCYSRHLGWISNSCQSWRNNRNYCYYLFIFNSFITAKFLLEWGGGTCILEVFVNISYRIYFNKKPPPLSSVTF